MRLSFVAGLTVLGILVLISNADSKPASYRIVQNYSIPGDGRWDYISLDSEARRLYVSHGTQLEVLDADAGKVIGHIANTPGVHGAAIASEFHHGFTSNGDDKSVTIFDTKTLAIIKKTPLQNEPDAIIYDAFSKRVFPLSEKMTVLDAQTGDVVGTLDVGGDTEAGVSDESGAIYVNLADKAAIAVVDTKALSVVKTYPLDHCMSPHSLSFDAANHRLFVGCRDGFAAVDSTTGRIVGRSLMCSGVDSGGFDAESKLIFESCSEGVITVIHETTPDYYELVATIPTQLYAKTMAFDSKTKNIYLPTAEFETIPNTDPKFPLPFQRKIKPGSFRVLVVSKR